MHVRLDLTKFPYAFASLQLNLEACGLSASAVSILRRDLRIPGRVCLRGNAEGGDAVSTLDPQDLPDLAKVTEFRMGWRQRMKA